ncbi:MAG: glyoxalase [Candidatus Dactylopiibacterium carminicum]|uniref:Bleomycin resistance protein n=1 Tax=Candidatus Dactylopiibacterium carminicum TaxID=857335 RepID=A0A272ERN1_9RHOO|nr:VOC family protein [Candidatus Dactylopiibacterium carminicum]KAF7598853.1 VOC family protein [Candidatus Dactylopiibacterium carminicum]PAS92769.1 MAG: glyoxalase [Candidatus Dactylopiibacterium carminicum]PAS96219.1 MAG: glyoxalase [Candidatus Dactylopiibacterium carminicum]PAS98870.1 MAG: glyoxalase [Candidatus Dactylopiibacterium carminicum]
MTQTVIPQLRIISATRSLPFYLQGLGFGIDWQHQFEQGFPLFFQITRNGQTIFLTEHTGDCQVGGAVYFHVPDVDACYRSFVANGVVVSQPPRDMPWEMREMLVTDPDGNRLRFASELPAEPLKDSACA